MNTVDDEGPASKPFNESAREQRALHALAEAGDDDRKRQGVERHKNLV